MRLAVPLGAALAALAAIAVTVILDALHIIRFGSPVLLAFVALVPLAVALVLAADAYRELRAAAWASPGLLPNMVADPGGRRQLPLVLFLAAASLLLVGFARPQRHVTIVKPGATVVVAIDDSGSMAATDVKPSRLGAADADVRRFLAGLPSLYQVALVVVANDAEIKVAPTSDRAALLAALPKTAQLAGTALADGVASAVHVAHEAIGGGQLTGKTPPAAVLVLSDGGSNEGVLTLAQAAADARKAGIPVSAIALGGASGSVTQHLTIAGSSQKVAETIQVPADPRSLEALAHQTGGTFITTPSAAQFAQVTHALGRRLVYTRQWRELTLWLSGVAIGLVLAGALCSGIRFRRLV